MSLASAILEYADSLPEELKPIATTLRLIVKASEGTTYAQPMPPLDPELEQMMKVAAERKKIQAERRLLENVRDEQITAAGVSTAEVIGGPAATEGVASVVEIDPRMPHGAKVPLAGAVYVFQEDGKLHYSEAETLKNKKPSKLLVS